MKELFPASNTVLDWFMCTAELLLDCYCTLVM